MAVYKITVLNDAGTPLSGAVVAFGAQDGYGDVLKQTTGADGSVNIDESVTGSLQGVPVYATASYPGLETYTWSGAQMTGDKTITLPKDSTATAILLGSGAVAALWLLNRKKKKVSGFFGDLSPMTKNIMVLGAVGGGLWLLLKSGLLGAGEGSGAALATAAANQLQVLAASGNGPTISAVQAEGFASSLRTAFDDCGTDTDTVNSVFASINNTADVLLLVSTYGTRAYKGCFDGDWFSDHAYNLSEALTSELSGSDLSTLNNNLSAKGIDYKF